MAEQQSAADAVRGGTRNASRAAGNEAKLTRHNPRAGAARAGRAAKTGGREVERDVEQHPRAVAGGAATGAVGGGLLGGPPGAIVGAVTGAARGLVGADALDIAKKHAGNKRDGRAEPETGV